MPYWVATPRMRGRWTGPGTGTGKGTARGASRDGGGSGDENGHNRRDTMPSALRIGDQPDRVLSAIARRVGAWQVTPTGTEGYRTAEVTLGGVDTAGLSSRDMQARGAGAVLHR